MLLNPFAIQCLNCKSILSDSFSLIDYKKNLLIFNSVTENVLTNENKLESKDSFDKNCWFQYLNCICGKNIGKKYFTINNEINNCIGKFTIRRDEIFSYVLGNNTNVLNNESEVNVHLLAEEVNKIKKVIVEMYKKR